MIYELAHFIKARCTFLWNAAERLNGEAFSLRYGRRLKTIDDILLNNTPGPFIMRTADKSDAADMETFFKAQPKESFRYFRPHGFDRISLTHVIKSKSFLTFILTENDAIVGYAFMRSFVNGTSYRGYMVDYRRHGQGIAKIMGQAMNSVGDALQLKMYKSISPDNVASMKVTEAVCDMETIKTLSNGDYLIKCMSKPLNIKRKPLGGGRRLPFVAQPERRLSYAA